MTTFDLTKLKQLVRTLVPGVVLMFCFLALAGCGENDDLKLEQARIALANDKPDRAILLVDQVLVNDPANFDARLIQAKSQIALDRLGPAKLTLDRLQREKADDPQLAEALLDWSTKTLDSVLNNPAFAITQADREAYEQAMQTAAAQLPILKQLDGSAADVLFIKAQLTNGELRHARIMASYIQRMIEQFGPDAELENASAAGQGNPEQEPVTYADQLKQYQQVQDALLDRMLNELEELLKVSPGNLQATDLFLRTASRESRWDRVIAQVKIFSEQTDLPVPIAERSVTVLLAVPENVITLDERIALGEAVLRATPADQSQARGRLISSARLLLASGQTEKALPILAKVIEENPENLASTYLLYAHALYETGDYETCRDIVEKLMPKLADVSEVQTVYGLTLWRLGEITKAKTALREACRLDPDNTSAVDAFTSLMAQQGMLSVSGEDVEALYKLDPDNPRAILFKLQHAATSGDPQQAVGMIDALENKPDHTDEELSLLYTANTMLSRYHAAEQWAKRYIERHPDDQEAWMRLAAAQLRQNNELRLNQTLQAIVERFPEVSSKAQLTGELYLQTQQYERAAASLGMALEDDSDNIRLRIELARAFAAMARFNSAMDEVNKVLKVEPDNIQALALGARITETRGDKTKADEFLSKIDPDNPEVQNDPALLAQVYVSRDQLDDAEAVCTKALASGNASPVLRLVLADIYQRKNEPERAEEHLVALVRHYPNSAEVYAWLGQFYASAGQFDQGIEKLKGVEVYNESLAVLAQAGLLRAADRLDDAIQALDALLDRLISRRDPMAQTVADAMAQLYEQKGDELAAESVYDRLYRQQAAATSELLGDVITSWDTDSPAQRLTKLDAAATRVPSDDTAAMIELSRRYTLLGRTETALSIVQRALIQAPNNIELLAAKAGILVMTGKPDEALNTYQLAIKQAPSDKTLRIRYARALSASGKRPEAEDELSLLIREGGDASLKARTALIELYTQLGLHERALSAVMAVIDKLPAGQDAALDLAIGNVLMRSDRHLEAQGRLAAINDDSPYYPLARIAYAQSQAASGDMDAAKAEVAAMVSDPGYSRRAIPVLLAMDPADATDRTLLIAADDAADTQQLPYDLTQRWLSMRLRLADLTADWQRADGALEQIARITRDDQVTALRIVLKYQLGDNTNASTLLRQTPMLESSATGSLLKIALGTRNPGAGRVHPMAEVLTALNRGEPDRLKQVMAEYYGIRTLFLDDLLTACKQGEQADEAHILTYRDLAAATVAMESNLPGLAAALCDTALKRTPDSLPAFAILVGANIENDADATQYIDLAKQLSPDGSLLLMINLVAGTAKKDHESAIVALKQLTTRNPNDPYLTYQLAQELGAAGHYEEAAAIYQPITETAGPYQMAAKNDLAYLRAKQGGQLDSAITLAREVYAALPDVPPVLDTTGWIEHLRGSNQVAIELLAQAIPNLSDIPEAHYHIGAVYHALGQERWAGYHLQQAAAAPEDEPGVKEARKLLEEVNQNIALP